MSQITRTQGHNAARHDVLAGAVLDWLSQWLAAPVLHSSRVECICANAPVMQCADIATAPYWSRPQCINPLKLSGKQAALAVAAELQFLRLSGRYLPGNAGIRMQLLRLLLLLLF